MRLRILKLEIDSMVVSIEVQHIAGVIAKMMELPRKPVKPRAKNMPILYME